MTAVASVGEALEVMERSRPDVILSDIRIPDEDGYALIFESTDTRSSFGMADSSRCYNSLSYRRPSQGTKSRFSVALVQIG
ncbi:hypothetical protein [Scytonema sp. NUACC26]|uniref:hypothetical protein n=1 Tax=Scytonema sp. NUACC26 TaxID=3140176 RepID=UPI0038B2E72D